jgi:glycosyltransferase involved in cell wall biosynthesis
MKILVLMPTYNEIETLEASVANLFQHNPEVDLMIIDDNSPDGTGALANRIAQENSRVSVLHRTGKEGLGRAYIAGFREGLARGYQLFVQMDADGSHRPQDLPAMLEASVRCELVIGSRWIIGGAVSNWPWYRQGISQFGNWYAGLMLGLNIRDVTAGYRVYHSNLIEKLALDEIQAQGYGFQVEMTMRSVDLGASACEVPILFVERENGRSKMTLEIVLEAFLLATKWGIIRLFRRSSGH